VSAGLAPRLLRRARRVLLRQRWAAPLLAEWDRWRLLRALQRRREPLRRVLAPAELVADLPDAVAYRRSFDAGADLALGAAVLRTDRLQDIDLRTLGAVRARMVCTHLGGAYALFEPVGFRTALTGHDVDLLLERLAALRPGDPSHRPAPTRRALDSDAAVVRRAVLVTTYARPAALQRSLPQIMALGAAVVLVIDDGSPPEAREANRAICAAAGATYLPLPENRGLPTAYNLGLGYLMADPAVRWISAFQDDVDVHPEALTRLIAVEDAETRPLLTGYDADEHPPVDQVEIAGIMVKRKRSSPAVHLHAHVDYWAGVMPIPSPYVGAPKPRRGASMEDWWIVNHAPRSAEQRGILVGCVPGLVRTFLWHRDDSTWDNENQPDPAL
jgi:Glycosyl transferase family 2